jgi:hypothetical protein
MSKLFAALLIMLELYNHFSPTKKLFLDLRLDKFSDTSSKPFFPCAVSQYGNFNTGRDPL